MVFLRHKQARQEGYTIGYIQSRGTQKGEIGIEVEVEGNKFPVPSGQKGTHHPVPMPGMEVWSYVHDGSLRGQDNAEYLLTKPVMFGDVEKAVDDLWKAFDKHGSVLDVSNRTSVHVHLNCQPFHMNRLAAFIGLYLAVEEVLATWCGEHRVGNLFCLRGRDAPAIVSQAKKYIQNDGRWDLRDGLHYAGLNLHSLTKHGSIEVRTLRGAIDKSVVLEWVGILRRIYELSAEYKDPRDVCGAFSGGSGGPLGFYKMILGEYADRIQSEIGWDDSQVKSSMYSGIRLAQDVCYCRDWSLFDPIDIEADPFGRLKKPKGVVANAAYEAALQHIQNFTMTTINPTTSPAAMWVQPSDTWGNVVTPSTPDEEPEEDYEPEPDYEEDDGDY